MTSAVVTPGRAPRDWLPPVSGPQPDASSAGLIVRGLYKSYGEILALDGVDLDVPPGKVTALLGPNGSGKTTLLSAIAGLLHADGEIHLDGIDAAAHPARVRGNLSLAPQEVGLYAVLPVVDNLRFFGALAGLGKKQLRQRVDEIAAALGLTPLLARPVQRLSTGEKRRVQTATALLIRPPLLLLDEATAGVDVASRAATLSAVRAVADSGSAVCYSTHYLTEAEELDALVTILHHGTVIASGPVDQLVAEYGEGVVELSFEGPAPATSLACQSARDGSTLRVFTSEPSAVATVLGALGHDIQRLRSITTFEPSLETVFLSLTGEHFSDETPGDAPDD
jgi:ABC-2 type transport system ATP-binding protein